MKKLFSYLLLLTASVTLMSGGCSGDDPDEPSPGPGPTTDELTVSPTSLSFPSGYSDEQLVTITSSTAGWTAKSDQDWCTTSRKSTTSLGISAGYNYTTSERTATVTVTAGERTATIKVTQAASEATLTLSQSAIHFTTDGGQDSLIQISCSPTYEGLRYEVQGGGDWLSVSPASGEASGYVYLAASYNHAFNPRSATITFTLPEAEPKVIHVTQAAGFVFAEVQEGEQRTFPYFYDTSFYEVFTVVTTSDDPENISLRLSEPWLHLKSESSHKLDDEMIHYSWWDEEAQHSVPVSFHQFRIYADGNPKYQRRYATADLFYRDSLLASVDLMQYQLPRFSVQAPHGTTLPTSGGSLDVRVYANWEWKYGEPSYADKGEPWVTVQRIGDSVLRFSCEANKTGNPRPDCYVLVESAGYSHTVVIKEGNGTAGEGYGYGDGTQWDEE